MQVYVLAFGSRARHMNPFVAHGIHKVYYTYYAAMYLFKVTYIDFSFNVKKCENTFWLHA